jgi:hypothetical protein
LRVDALHRCRAALRQISESLEIDLGVRELGLVARLLGLGLLELGLERARIDLRQEIPPLTSSPSANATLSIWPSTRVRTVTVLNACTLPIPVR